MGYSMNSTPATAEELAQEASSIAVDSTASPKARHGYVPWLVALVIIALWWLVSALHLFTTLALPSPQ